MISSPVTVTIFCQTRQANSENYMMSLWGKRMERDDFLAQVTSHWVLNSWLGCAAALGVVPIASSGISGVDDPVVDGFGRSKAVGRKCAFGLF